MDWTIGVRYPTKAEDFSSSLCVQTGSGAHPASYPVGTGGSFPGVKARPGRDADHSLPSSDEVKYEEELYLLFPQTPPWHVAGQLYFAFLSAFLLYHPIPTCNSDSEQYTTGLDEEYLILGGGGLWINTCSSRDEFVRSTSVRSKRQGDQKGGRCSS
jgi:hypothetical protein